MKVPLSLLIRLTQLPLTVPRRKSKVPPGDVSALRNVKAPVAGLVILTVQVKLTPNESGHDLVPLP